MLTTPDKYKWRRIGGAAGPNPLPIAPAPVADLAALFQFIKMPQILIYYCHFVWLPHKIWVSPAFIHLAT